MKISLISERRLILTIQNYRENYHYFITCLIIGISIIALSIMILIDPENFWIKIFQWLGWLMIFGAIRAWLHYFRKPDNQFLLRGLLNTFAGFLLITFSEIPSRLAFILMAVYIIANAIIKLVSYLLFRKSAVTKRFVFLLTAIILIIVGLSILAGETLSTRWTMIYFGIYGLFLGLTYLRDGFASITPKKQKEALKRRFRVSPPLIITALMPRLMLEKINESVANEALPNQAIFDSKIRTNVEILVHVTENGFGAIGHCDLIINNQVISYGNYDSASYKLFDALGDGVLLRTNKDSYIPFCLKESQKTIFSYGLLLDSTQLEQVERDLNKLLVPAYDWRPKAFYDSSSNQDYASKVYLESDKKACFSKFSSGKYQTYFVLGANCVEVVEALLGPAGMDIIRFNGIVSPGAYQDYLEKEYRRGDGIVLSKQVYQPK